MKKYILSIAALLVFQLVVVAQNHYNIRLQSIEQNNPNKDCYHVQLAAADATDLNLAGQNYRLYYDASKLSYADSKSLLPATKYDNFRARAFVGQESAQGMGYLPFEENLGLLSMDLDLDDVKRGGIMLDAFGTWQNTCQVCFDKIAPKTEIDELGSLVWARSELTASYATAYVEVAEWISEKTTIPALADQYQDMAFSTTATSSEQWEDHPRLYPNPVKDRLTIEQRAEALTQVEVWSIHGQQVLQQAIPAGDGQYVLDMGQLAAGMYQIRLTKNSRTHVQFVEKQ